MGQLIKLVFSDILKPYKNFLHFVLSKIIIYLAVTLITIVLALPFLGLLAIILFSNGLNVDILALLESPVKIVLSVLIFILLILAISIGYGYSFLLLNKLNLKYIKGKKLAFSKNYYLNFKLFYNYVKVFLLNFVILLSPILLFLVVLFVLISFAGGYEQALIITQTSVSNPLSISLLVSLIVCFLIFIYLTYRTLFSYIILVHESNGIDFTSPLYYVKKSFSLTKGFKTLFRFIVIGLLVLMITLPIYVPQTTIGIKVEKLGNYLNMKYDNPESATIEENMYYFQNLELEYGNISETELRKSYNINKSILILFSILEFLLINGIFNMMLVSFYLKEMKRETEPKKRFIEKVKEVIKTNNPGL